MSKTALVTGCSSGIGASVTQNLLEQGWSVIGISRRLSSFSRPKFRHLAIDLTDVDEVQKKLTDIDRVDAIIHAAGLLRVAPHNQLNFADGELMWRTHVQAAAALVNTLTRKMPNGGRIVLIGSRVSEGAKDKSLYAASKAAYRGLVRSIALELANRAITVNIVSPAATETPMLKDPRRAGTKPVTPPFGRLIKPEEIAGTVNFLLSSAAASITGQNIVVCAGASL